MQNLRQKMADNGFESNESYDYAVKCLRATPDSTIPCLNIEGDPGRHKTAFATALAQALETAHVLYHDFTQQEETLLPQHYIPANEEENKPEPPLTELDRIVSDACAYSEAEKTVLILDQLHAADFKQHIRLYKFLISQEWTYRDASFYANRKNLSLFIISEESVYHSLQKHSFKVWVSNAAHAGNAFTATDFQLDAQAEEMICALNRVFEHLQITPTYSEYKKIIHDIQQHVHTIEDLMRSIYGWTEGIDHQRLYSDNMRGLLENIMPAIQNFIGIEENIELHSHNS